MTFDYIIIGAGTLGLLLNRLFQNTFAVAKRVRTETGIGYRLHAPDA